MNGEIYFTENVGSRVLRYDPATGALLTVVGNGGYVSNPASYQSIWTDYVSAPGVAPLPRRN